MSYSLPTAYKNLFSQSLREKALRPTKQRACVYGIILEKRDHPTADDIYHRVRKYLPGTSFATVYNCLETLVGCGLIRQVNVDRSPTCYCPNLTPHAHFKCTNTGKIFDIQIDKKTLSEIEALVPDGYESENIDLCFSGKVRATQN